MWKLRKARKMEKKKLEKVQAELARLKRTSSFELERKSTSKRRAPGVKPQLSVRGAYSMAVRRLTGHASGDNVLQILDVNKDKRRVFHWEKMLYQNRLLQTRHWYAAHHDLLRRALGRPVSGNQWFSFEVNRVRMGARHSAAAQRYKAPPVGQVR